jgi:hypothetical protein
MKLDAVNAIIAYTTGSKIGHTAMALWENDILYVVESQGGADWPVEGIQKTEFYSWIRQCKLSGYSMGILVKLK